MFTNILLLSIAALISSCHSSTLNTRSVFRSGEGGAVSLLEFNVKGTIYGRCSFRDAGEDVTATYEETNEVLLAKTNNPQIADPVSKAQKCRAFAATVPEAEKEQRTDVATGTVEPDLELLTRLKEYDIKMAENQEYVESLKPKFIGLLSNWFTNSGSSNAYGISFGSTSTNLFPGFNVGVPTISNVEATIGSSFNTNPIFKWFGRRRR